MAVKTHTKDGKDWEVHTPDSHTEVWKCLGPTAKESAETAEPMTTSDPSTEPAEAKKPRKKRAKKTS